MRRRQFITLLGGAAAWPLAARAQHAGKMWRIGFITHAHQSIYEILFERLRELGYVEGQNIIIERRYAEGRAERFQEFAAEMVRLKADLIMTITTPAALAAKNTTTMIPIVIPTAIDRRDSHRGNGSKTAGASQGSSPSAFPDGCPVE